MPLIIEHQGNRPVIADNVFIAPNATIIGNVEIRAGASIWYGAILRGDFGKIVIGERTNVQDNVVIHVNERHDTIIGAGVTIGHGVVLEGCNIADNVLLGMNSTILSGSTVGEGSLIAAGAVVREYAEIPADSLAVGVPAKVRGGLPAEMRERITYAATHYVEGAEVHKNAPILDDESL